MNRFIWIAIIIVLTIAALIFIYWFTTGFLTVPAPIGQPGQLPAAVRSTADTKLKLVSGEELAGYWLDEEGRIYLIKATGEIIGVSTQKIADINRVSAAADGRRALIAFNYPDNFTFAVADIANQSRTLLPEGTAAAAWHPQDGNKLMYLRNGDLRLLNLQTGKSSLIMSLNFSDILMDWPEAGRVLLTDRPAAIFTGKSWAVNLNNKTVEEAAGGAGLILKENSRWRLLFTGSINRQADRLLLSDKKSGAVLADFDSLFSEAGAITLPDKCVLGDSEIYCAFPKNVPSAVTLPDDYLKRKFISDDAFYKITVKADGAVKAELIHNPLSAVDVSGLTKSADKLYFLNRRDGGLYSLDL